MIYIDYCDEIPKHELLIDFQSEVEINMVFCNSCQKPQQIEVFYKGQKVAILSI